MRILHKCPVTSKSITCKTTRIDIQCDRYLITRRSWVQILPLLLTNKRLYCQSLTSDCYLRASTPDAASIQIGGLNS